MFLWLVVVGMGLQVGELAPAAPAAGLHCSDLRKRMDLRYQNVPVIINGKSLNVTVMGEGGGARATAALWYVLLRYGLGYAVRLVEGTPDLCDLSDLGKDWRTVVTVIAPVATITSSKCSTGIHQLDALTTIGSAMVDVSLHLMAYLWNTTCTSLIIKDSVYVNISLLEDCQFTKTLTKSTDSSRDCTGYFAILVRNQTKIDDLVANELEKQIAGSKIPLQIMYFKNDTLFRKQMHELKQQQKSFLFLDDNIWNNISNIFNANLPLCLGCRNLDYSVRNIYAGYFRTGNGFNMRTNAPAIYKMVSDIKPNTTELLQIMENEISVSNIEEATCMWALQNFKQFRQLIPSNFNDIKMPFVIFVYLCNGDRYIKQNIADILQNVLNLFKDIFRHINLTINYMLFNCHKSDFLANEFNELAHDQSIKGIIKWSSIVGTITWGSIIAVESGAKKAEEVGLPMLLAGPTSPGISQGSIVHSASGSINQLTRAYINLLRLCDWSRLAIISDNTTYAKTFMDNLRLTENNIIHREIIITSKNVRSNLKNLEIDDARIILINTHWEMTSTILCAASNMGMTDARFVWIARDWRFIECDNFTHSESLYHYTLELTSIKSLNLEDLKTLNISLMNHTKLTPAWVDSISLMDALVQLGHWVTSVIHKNPSHLYTLHEETGKQKFLDNFNETARAINTPYPYPLVIVGKWLQSKGNVAAMWHITPENIIDIGWSRNATQTCEDILGRKPPQDRFRCLIQTGDAFAPRCHHMVFFISIALLTFLLAVIYKVFRNRQLAIQLIEEQQQEYLINSRQRAASILENYIVKRNAVQLMHVIGLGSFGQVRFAKLHRTDRETVVVAAKEPRNFFSYDDENIFLREACVLALLNHENVIRLEGVCFEDGPPMVLMEHAFYNDLQNYLVLRREFVDGARRTRVTAEQALEVSDEELTRFARQAAGALDYLTKCRLVHRDVRAGNCLVDENRSLKLADFGMARELDSEEPQYVTQRRALFPVIWMAPESIKCGIFSPATDVWSLGVLFLEVATFGSRPFGDWSPDVVVRYIRCGGHPPLPPDISIYTSRLVLDCWHSDPESRPSAAQIHKYLSCNPHAISPALLPPHLPELPFHFTH